MWKWLAENPDKSKEHAIKALNLPSMVSNCACCQYVEDMTGRAFDCNQCPLFNHWTENMLEREFHKRRAYLKYQDYCMDSTYWEWEYEDDMAERSRLAQLISDAAQLELDKLCQS